MLHRQFFLDTILRKSSFAGQKFVTPTCWMKFGWFELKQEKREDLNFQGRIVCTAHRNYSYNTVLFLNQRRVHHLAYCVCKMRHMWIKTSRLQAFDRGGLVGVYYHHITSGRVVLRDDFSEEIYQLQCRHTGFYFQRRREC